MLTVEIKLNDILLYSIRCMRDGVFEDDNKDVVFLYEVEVYYPPQELKVAGSIQRFTLKHNYKDGSKKLVDKIMKHVTENPND